MNELKFLNTVVLVLLLSATRIVFASPVGEVNFDDLSKAYGTPKVEINLSKALIGMVSALSKNEDPEIGEMLSKLELIKVRVFELGGDASTAINAVEQMTQKIRKDNWEPIVSVNEEASKVQVFTKTSNEVMDGLVVMVVDSSGGTGEAVFINIVGEIDPNNISKVTESLNIQY